MKSVNRIVILWTAWRPELKAGQSGGTVGTFSVSVNHGTHGKGKPDIDSVRVVFYGDVADSNSGIEGHAVLVEGRVRTRQVNSGESKAYVTEVVAETVSDLWVPGNPWFVGYSKTTVLGNVSRVAETKTLADGSKMCSFGVATNRIAGTGESKKEVAEFHNAVSFGKLAEGVVAKYVVETGARILIEGRLKTRGYKAKDGSKREVSEIVLSDISLLGKKESSKQKQSGAFDLSDFEEFANA